MLNESGKRKGTGIYFAYLQIKSCKSINIFGDYKMQLIIIPINELQFLVIYCQRYTLKPWLVFNLSGSLSTDKRAQYLNHQVD